jgi:hypothetical protein
LWDKLLILIGLFGLFERFGGLKTLEFLEGAVVVAVDGVEAALKARANVDRWTFERFDD